MEGKIRATLVKPVVNLHALKANVKVEIIDKLCSMNHHALTFDNAIRILNVIDFDSLIDLMSSRSLVALIVKTTNVLCSSCAKPILSNSRARLESELEPIILQYIEFKEKE